MGRIVYHGSNSNFKKLRIAKKLVRYQSTLENEGMGIYFSTDKEVAKSYGKYLYTIELSEEKFLDFRNKGVCRNYVNGIVKHVQKETGVAISQFIGNELYQTVGRVYFGGLAISGICREIELLLDNCQEWCQLPKNKIDRVYRLLRSYSKNHLGSYMFNYNIRGIGVIKDVDEGVARIIKKEKVG